MFNVINFGASCFVTWLSLLFVWKNEIDNPVYNNIFKFSFCPKLSRKNVRGGWKQLAKIAHVLLD